MGAHGRSGPGWSDCAENLSVPRLAESELSGGVGLVCGMNGGISGRPNDGVTGPSSQAKFETTAWARESEAVRRKCCEKPAGARVQVEDAARKSKRVELWIGRP
jgi:hypothetical protein